MTLPRPTYNQPPPITNPNNGISFQGLQIPHKATITLQWSFFEDAAAEYIRAAQGIYELSQRESSLKQSIALRRVDLETIEARLIMDGSVTGTNAEQRKASLLLWCRDDQEYQATRADQTVDEAELAGVEAQLELARDARSISKRRMDAFVAVTNLEAASLK